MPCYIFVIPVTLCKIFPGTHDLGLRTQDPEPSTWGTISTTQNRRPEIHDRRSRTKKSHLGPGITNENLGFMLHTVLTFIVPIIFVRQKHSSQADININIDIFRYKICFYIWSTSSFLGVKSSLHVIQINLQVITIYPSISAGAQISVAL